MSRRLRLARAEEKRDLPGGVAGCAGGAHAPGRVDIVGIAIVDPRGIRGVSWTTRSVDKSVINLPSKGLSRDRQGLCSWSLKPT